MRKPVVFAVVALLGSAAGAAYRIPFGTELHYTVRPLAGGIVRITCGGYDEPEESLLERYGIIEDLPEDATAKQDGRTVSFSGGVLRVDEQGGLELSRDGRVLMRTSGDFVPATAPTLHRNGGFTFAAALAADEKILGGGDSQRDRLALNGGSGRLWIGDQKCHIPEPFYMSSRGWGVLLNTTRQVDWDVDSKVRGVARFSVRRQMLDGWLFTGDFYGMIDAFTRLTGRPHLPPVKSFGIWLIPFYGSDVNAVRFLTASLRKERIPCDNISLEPGWMEKDYDQSVDRDWNMMRFMGCNPKMWRGPARALTDLLKSDGFNFGLWFCCQWDFTYEEERRLPPSKRRHASDAARDALPALAKDGALVDARIGWQTRQDKVTDPEKPYFDHMRKFAVQDGVDYFKLDACCLLSEFPDRLYGNGKTDEEMHNLAFLLEAKQTFGDFELAVTNKRAYGIHPAGTVGVQRYAGTWTGDTGGGLGPLLGIFQNAVCGHSLSACDIDVKSVEGIHMGLLLPWALVDSWSSPVYPGMINPTIDAAFRDYARLRMTLVPYFYSLMRTAHETGRPIVRPLCLEWPEVAATYAVTNQFLVGRDLLVSARPVDGRVFLPKGRWYDWWTHRVVEGRDDWMVVPVPAGKGGHLFVREGAVIPTVPPADFIVPGKLDAVTWLVFPSEKETSFDLYHDDGLTRRWQHGDFAKQRVVQKSGKLMFGPVVGEARFLKDVRHEVRVL